MQRRIAPVSRAIVASIRQVVKKTGQLWSCFNRVIHDKRNASRLISPVWDLSPVYSGNRSGRFDRCRLRIVDLEDAVAASIAEVVRGT